MATGVRALIYARVSKDDSGKQRSVGQQEAECRAWCAEHGWSVVDVVTDNDRSASRYAVKARPGYREMRAALDAGEVDILVTWEASRVTRDLDEFTDFRKALEWSATLWFYGERLYDMRVSRDRREATRDALGAEEESEKTAERIRRNVRSNAAAGRPHGKLLYGYARRYDPATRELVAQEPHPEQAPVVVEVAERLSRGEALYAVAQDLNARAVPAPRGGRWDGTQLRRIATNAAYIGRRVHQGRVMEGVTATWPPLVPEQVFYANVSRLTDPSRRTNEGRGALHLLTGLALCGVCGAPVRVLNNRSCLSYQCGEKFCTSRRKDLVDDLVERVVLRRLAQPDVLDLLAHDDDAEHERTAARNEAAEKRSRLDGFYDAAAAGEVTAHALARIEARLLPEIEAADKRGRRAGISPLLLDLTGDDVQARWERLSLEQKREVISVLVRVVILPVGRGHRVFNPESVKIEWRTS